MRVAVFENVILALTVAGALAACQSAQEVLATGEAAESNPGPCPRAFAISDAARIVEFVPGEDGEMRERFDNVGFTGEISRVRSLCRYYGERPIEAGLDIDMNFGRGPSAVGDTATYELFVAVTRKNIDVIAKEVMSVTVRFPEGVDIVSVSERVDEIVIPRANSTTSGENFEIITGFVVTDSQRAFNADGKRFRVSAGSAQ